MRKRRFGIFSRSELSAASFILMEAVTDELLREFMRCPDRDSDSMSEYLAIKKVNHDAIDGIYENMELSVPKLLSVIRASKNMDDPETIARELQVIVPFVETCQEIMARQQDMEPKRSLKDGYYYE